MHGAKVEGSFKAHSPYLGEAIDAEIMVTQLAEAKLGSEGRDTGQEDTVVGTLEEYVAVSSFELP